MITKPAVPDGMLADFVEMANQGAYGSDGSEGIQLILSVSGLTIAGELVAGDQWAREHEAYREGLTQAGTFKHHVDFYEARRARLNEIDQVSDRLTDDQRQALLASDAVEFLHLRNAKVYLTGIGGMPANAGMLWRGRIASVDGWALGALTAEAPLEA